MQWMLAWRRHPADIVTGMAIMEGPLLVYGPRSLSYDFGDHHPLTPRRFGPGISLLQAVGAQPAVAPEPATDDELAIVHTRRYIEAVRRFSDEPWLPGAMGIGHSDNPAFTGMHDAAAAVAGGSLAAMRSILAGDVLHAHHPGGGLHHAMPERAWGFCIYDDPAIAIAAARAAGLRVLYVDLDVHHGDGVQAVFYRDPGVLTVSIHESGRYLFPETGFPDELGEGAAAGTAVNVPFEPFAGADAWLPVVLDLVPALAAAFGPDVVVSQHGADAHAWDPLAHLRVTTTAQWEAARMVDAVAHRWARGRWLATGGGGYDVYRVVPRTWALTWLAGAHREPPVELPAGWRSAWTADAERYGQSPIPATFLDEPNAGLPVSTAQADADRRSRQTAVLVRHVVLPALLREAIDRGWWSPAAASSSGSAPSTSGGGEPGSGAPSVVPVDRAMLDRLSLASRIAPIADAGDVRAILEAALTEPGVAMTGAVAGSTLLGMVVSAPALDDPARRALLSVAVAASFRQRGLGTAMLRAHLDRMQPDDVPVDALATVAERDRVEPLEHAVRARIARRLLERAGFGLRRPESAIVAIDDLAIAATGR